MAENSAIEWTHHTFNPWIGCTKVGPGCDNCYAADLSKARLGVKWGAGEERRHTAASTWKKPRAWNRKAQAAGEHHDMHRWIEAGSMPSKVYGHATVKPDAVMSKIMRNLSGATICDPFMGTGSTGVAAIRAGKRFVGIERNPAHFETACRRIKAAVAEVMEGEAA